MKRSVTEIMDDWKFTLSEPLEQNFELIQLPHDWAIIQPIIKDMDYGNDQAYRYRWGIGWYIKELVIEKSNKNNLYYLEFDGVYENCTVWVNDMIAGGCKYGYSNFKLDITPMVQDGVNTLRVKVDNTAMPADRWYSGAGIYRTVKLIELNRYHIKPEEVHVTTSISDGKGIVKINTGMDAKINAIITDGTTKIEGTTTNGIIELEIPHAKLWSPDEPFLYVLELLLFKGKSIVDEYSLNIGIREIHMIPNDGMYLNGNKLKIKGLCLHQDAGCLGTAVPIEIWEERLLLLKQMGCNAIRAAHHIFASEFLDLCDTIGFLLYEESFDKWTSGAYGRYFEKEWKNDLDSMIKRDRNHPCIFMWGVGNEVENQGQESMLKILKMLTEHVRTIDNTRPVSYAMNPHFKKETNINVSDIKDIQKFVDEEDDTEIYDTDEKIRRIQLISEYVDVIACNYQEHLYTEIHKAIPDKLLLGTETYQYFTGHKKQLQNFSDEIPWMSVEKFSYVIGGMIWTGIDYLGESMGFPSKGWTGALIRTNCERKPISYLYQSYWSEKPMVHFAVMDYSQSGEMTKEHWDAPRYATHWEFPYIFKSVVPYMIATNCEEVRIDINSRLFYVKNPSSYPNRMITGYLPYNPGSIKVIGLINNIEVCSHTIITPETAFKLSFDGVSHLLPKKGYMKLFTVRAKDINNNPVFKENRNVSFAVMGPAEIVAVDNGDLCYNESYNTNNIQMYNGCCSVVVRLTGEEGCVNLSAHAEGLNSTEMLINCYSN